MNLVLFRPAEVGQPLRIDDPRTRHVLDVLHRVEGDEFDAGLINGPRGKARIDRSTAQELRVSFRAESPAESPDPLTLLVGLPRPQTARDILREATTLGLSALYFVAGEKSEPSYVQSTLWRDGEWERHVIAGAQQAFSTLVPPVTFDLRLAAALLALPAGPRRVALDNYEATTAFAAMRFAPAEPLVLALGPERGWGADDRALLRSAGFTFGHLGARVLRLETAVVAALTLAKAARGTL
ncbi:MAG: 16S rRNA methyltransferase [Opitutus sp.]|nr:16S rRNA methyltransferase [Opitutus sp.]